MKTGSGNNERNVLPNKAEMSFLDSCSDDWRGLRRGMEMQGSPYGTSICTTDKTPHAMPLVAWCVSILVHTTISFPRASSPSHTNYGSVLPAGAHSKVCSDGLIIGAKERKESPDVDLKLLLRLLNAMQKQIRRARLLNANRWSRMD